MQMTIHSKPLKLSDQQKRSISILNDALRRGLEHFQPGLWTVNLSGMPRVASDILDIIRFLALETATYVNLTAYQQGKVKSLVYRSKRILRRSGP